MGAINLAVNGDARNDYIEGNLAHPEGEAAVDLLTEVIEVDGYVVWEFNDEEDTTLEQVRQLFLRAIEKAA